MGSKGWTHLSLAKVVPPVDPQTATATGGFGSFGSFGRPSSTGLAGFVGFGAQQTYGANQPGTTQQDPLSLTALGRLSQTVCISVAAVYAIAALLNSCHS